MNLRALRKRITPASWSVEKRRQWRDRVFRRFGIARCREPAVLVSRPDWRVGSLLRYFVADRLLAEPDLTFMQVGAYDGVVDDDLRDLIIRHRLCGVVIEPQMDAFARLLQTYQGQPQVTPLNAAISDSEGSRTLYYPRNGDAMTASFERGHLLRHGLAPDDIIERQVPCMTVASAMRFAGLDRLDLLQIDVEGHDHQIIRSLDFQSLRPSLLRFEYRHLPAPDSQQCLELLADWGYRFVVEEKDIIAYLECQHSANAAAA